MPKITTKFHSDVSETVYLKLDLQDIRGLSPAVLSLPVRVEIFSLLPCNVTQEADMLVQQVETLGPSAFEDVAHPDNYYHNVGENLLAYFAKACTYLGHCHDTSVQFFLHQTSESYAKFPLVRDKFSTFMDWGEKLPWFQPYITCLTDKPVRHINHTSFADQVGLCSWMMCLLAPEGWSFSLHSTCPKAA